MLEFVPVKPLRARCFDTHSDCNFQYSMSVTLSTSGALKRSVGKKAGVGLTASNVATESFTPMLQSGADVCSACRKSALNMSLVFQVLPAGPLDPAFVDCEEAFKASAAAFSCALRIAFNSPSSNCIFLLTSSTHFIGVLFAFVK